VFRGEGSGEMNEDTRKQRENWMCPEPNCGSTDRGRRYVISDLPEPERFCKNAWHDVPSEVHRGDFTEPEFQFIFAVCLGLSVIDIAERFQIAEDIVQRAIYQTIFDKAGVSNRAALVMFVRDALNGELRRRRS
jgi:DNA-binding NarL/FixJ family response regulator